MLSSVNRNTCRKLGTSGNERIANCVSRSANDPSALGRTALGGEQPTVGGHPPHQRFYRESYLALEYQASRIVER